LLSPAGQLEEATTKSESWHWELKRYKAKSELLMEPVKIASAGISGIELSSVLSSKINSSGDKFKSF